MEILENELRNIYLIFNTQYEQTVKFFCLKNTK